jgi:hypothetical protein
MMSRSLYRTAIDYSDREHDDVLGAWLDGASAPMARER